MKKTSLLKFAISLLLCLGLPGQAAAMLAYDYGDAPEPLYPTLLASDGARHQMSHLWLGNSVDYDIDGQPDPLALGDDMDGSDDDDGVAFTSIISAGQNAMVAIFSSGPGFLDGWIDFNMDGDWSDAGEQIFMSTPLTPGPNNLFFQTPAAALGGDTFGRFRLSSQGGLSFTGPAFDGEVEDYLVTVNAVPLPASFLLLSSGLIALVGMRKRTSK